MRSLLCKWFNLVRAEDVPNPWGNLLKSRTFQPVWPRIANSLVWQNDMKPMYEQMLLQTLFDMAKADPIHVLDLQVRARLLNDFLERVQLGMIREDALLENMAHTGGGLNERIERANSYVR